MRIKHAFLSVFILGLSISCSNDDDHDGEITPSQSYKNGILISNEGPFSNGTGTVSFISYDLEVVEHGIFKTVNQEDLGNIVQSMGFTDDKAFIIANVSNTLNVVDRYTFKKIGRIAEGLDNPRFFTAVNGKGYVTNWGDATDDTDDFIAVIDLEDLVVEATIPVDFGPEALEGKGTTLYVAHKGGFGYNNKVSVIDVVAGKVVKTLEVGDVPDSLQWDASGSLWVLASGRQAFTGTETGGVLSKINTTNNEVVAQWEFAETEHPGLLELAGNTAYFYLEGTVYRQSMTTPELQPEVLLEGVNFYTMAIEGDRLYGTDAKDFASNGTLGVYHLQNGEEIKVLPVGIIPGGIYFN